MDLTDLFKKQQQDLDYFSTMQNKAWAAVKKRHEEIAAGFGGVDNLPLGFVNQFKRDLDNYHKEWAINTGTRYLDIIAQHEKQRQAITGNKPEPQLKEPPKAQNDNISEKQDKLANLIKVQQAIKAKKIQNRPRH